MKQLLNIWWDERIVGQLSQDEHGELGFSYAKEWIEDDNAPQLSASLPKQINAFSRRECRPFFGGLLPEESQRDAVAKILGVSRGNDFALLHRLGGDVAGALQLLQIDALPQEPRPVAHPPALSEAELIRVLDTLPIRPLLAGEGELRLSLAGAQSKLPIILVDAMPALALPGQPTTHILKPPISRFGATTENEAFVMRLAKAVELDVANVTPRIIAGRTFLLIERYDRETNDQGTIKRLHQEDFCQALAVPSEIKYASEGGPSFRDCFDLLRRISARPAQDVLKLLDAAIFNLIVGNADAHGKNFSLLYERQGPRLAPLYDLLSTVYYPDLSPKLAMKIGKQAVLEDINTRTWAAFAQDSGLGLPIIRRRVSELSEAVLETASDIAQTLSGHGFDDMRLEQIFQLICDRARRCSLTTTRY